MKDKAGEKGWYYGMAREVEPTIDAKVKVKDSPDEQ
jgi:hypothetical protein